MRGPERARPRVRRPRTGRLLEVRLVEHVDDGRTGVVVAPEEARRALRLAGDDGRPVPDQVVEPGEVHVPRAAHQQGGPAGPVEELLVALVLAAHHHREVPAEDGAVGPVGLRAHEHVLLVVGPHAPAGALLLHRDGTAVRQRIGGRNRCQPREEHPLVVPGPQVAEQRPDRHPVGQGVAAHEPFGDLGAVLEHAEGQQVDGLPAALDLLAHTTQHRHRLAGVLLGDPPRRDQLPSRLELLEGHPPTLPERQARGSGRGLRGRPPTRAPQGPLGPRPPRRTVRPYARRVR